MLKAKSCICVFVDLEKVFDRVPRIVLEWAMRRKEISEVLVRSVTSPYEGAKTKVSMDSELSKEFEVIVGMPHGPVPSPFVSAVVDVVIVLVKESALSGFLYADDLVLMGERIE